MRTTFEKYEDDWYKDVDQLYHNGAYVWDRKDDPHPTIIRNQTYVDVQKELRKIVDESMRIELETLKKALIEDQKSRNVQSLGKSIGIIPKVKKEKEKKKKPEVVADLGDRSLKEYFEELKAMNVSVI